MPTMKAAMAPLLALALGAGSLPAQAAPQSPLVAGPYASVLKAIDAARACGIAELRLALPPGAKPYEAALFAEAGMTNAQQRCLTTWSTAHGKDLRLQPRWWRDDFTSDVPPGVTAPWPPDR
jgi:hypothetical protein